MADDPVEPQPQQRAWSNPRLTFRRLFGLDRSGPPPPQTLSGAPWNVWTIPNAIGFVRLALLVPMLVLGLSSDDGTDALPAILFAVVAWSDYADGIAARVTGQYSRFGALLDPIVDRLLVICGVVICWKFETLPRWGIAILIARELYLLVAGRLALRRGIELKINWWGRWGVWPTMSAIFFAMAGLDTVAHVLFYVGLALSLMAAVVYTRDALSATRAAPSS
ncbi:CDP-diacylglycerol--glycerol-3-phosphate 3-phosphatidyltransferase [Baekduia alba]|uniref:CDP-alcohol phosphatidyltransferase family protein n=1 Tax=Baekduia alba TaxID=2997333 RepID=UPI00234120D0|nr:CDP-alcohol phosphatidyltransferase family protein [Baekduia alba]WCB93968.1 CDP-diacylglycerol--glycerol-3-phosphate 3-phosphatidyltransferase [Baekduia alba]